MAQVTNDTTKIKWSDDLQRKFVKGDYLSVDDENIRLTQYRPFTKKYIYYDSNVIARPGRYREILSESNEIIYITGTGINREFSCIYINELPELKLLENGQGFYLYNHKETNELFTNMTNFSDEFVNKIGISGRDLMYYIYGILHSKEYRDKYANDLRKDLPRIPIVKNKEKFIQVGRKLSEVHLNYESITPSPSVKVEFLKTNPTFEVTRIKFAKKRDENNKSINDRNKIIFNKDIIITNIPKEAYEYSINGRTAIEWIMDQYQIKIDKNSEITDNPNEFSDNPKYILNLLLSIINVSVQTVELINSLPPLEIGE